MRLSIWFGVALVCSTVNLGCSGTPPQSVIIIQESPSTGGQTGTGGAPITFGGNHDAGAFPTGSGSGAASSGGAPNAVGSGAGGGASAASGVPCDVATYLAANCLGCHGSPPLPSALSALVTYDDLKATSKEDPTKNEAELSVARMQNAASPMPPGAPPSASDVAILQNWITAGYPKGTCGGGGTGDGGGGVVVTPPPSVFQDAPPFQSNVGDRAHNAGQDCMRCHQNGGGEAPRFILGGTLYDPAGNPVSGAEVRLVDASGNAKSTYSSTNGTFFMQGSGFAAPAHVGVRDGTNQQDMFTALQSPGGGACSSCHCTGGSCTVPPVHLP